MNDLALVDVADGIATVTMNRPEKRNALSPQLIAALEEAVTAVEADASVRVMILAGAGRSFCAGMDLHGVLDDPAVMGGMLHGLSRVARRIRRLPVPTIARVQGAAIGGGCGLMVVPDFSITHPRARVGYPEVSLGVCPAVVAPWLVRRIGAGRARSMLLAGGTVDGREALALGLATHLAEAGDLEREARELAAALAEGGADAMTATKRWLNELDGSDEDEVFERAADLSAEVIAGDEARTRLGEILGRG
ncbi:MAG: enoyl-CoA hydratase/isomerase family protein [Planctomycetota bacterium]|jgi:methylglutaconyl-CoA hydratase